MMVRWLMSGLLASSWCMAADPMRPLSTGFTWAFGKEASVHVRVLRESMPEGRLKWERGEGSWHTSWKSEGTGFQAETFRARGLEIWALHFLADKPGELGFRTSIQSSVGSRPAGRRLLTAEAGDESLFVWVVPMESDVERDGGAVLLRGEGEALVVVARGKTSIARLRQAGLDGDLAADPVALLGELESMRIGASALVRSERIAPIDGVEVLPIDALEEPPGEELATDPAGEQVVEPQPEDVEPAGGDE